MTTQISIRDDSTHAPPTVVVREARLSPHGRATNPPSRTGGISAASEGVASLGLIGSRTRLGSVAVNQADPRTNSPDSSRDGFDVSRRQLAADVIVRSIFIQRAYSLRSNKVENNPSNAPEIPPRA